MFPQSDFSRCVFTGLKCRFGGRYLVVPIIWMVLATVVVVRYSTLTQTPSQHVARDTPPPSPYCRSGDPLEGVYNPLRFRVLSKCEVASGIVESLTLQESGDQRIYVRLDPYYAKLIAVGNSNYQNTLLIVELIAENQARVPVPAVGQHITFVGPWVCDTDSHGNAIYHVWSIQSN
ncbi:hypothetical protein E6H32_09985 [Candidatus Bathyarchaeota archaeon]|nr:MAG: hypothetical protein E6H32_09985 [Candidatus Bathyarchaeota archaeon]